MIIGRFLPDEDCEPFQMKIPTSRYPIGFIKSKDFQSSRLFK